MCMRNFLVAGNWKMNGSQQQVMSLLSELTPLLSDLTPNVECVICPPSVYLSQCRDLINSTNMILGAQNVSSSNVASFTGEISATMLREFGCRYVIIGHSERRALLQESDTMIAAKFALALEAGLHPILCVGETKEQMQAGEGFAVVKLQLEAVLQKVGIAAFANAVIAYEPVWAIGTGLSATPQQAQNMHQQIRDLLRSLDVTIAAATKILYGGSVNSANAADLFKQQDIDGGLIGGASLKAQDFSEICHAAMRTAE